LHEEDIADRALGHVSLPIEQDTVERAGGNRFPFGLTLGGGLQYVGSSYIGRPDDAERIIPNGQAGKIPDYLVFNALVLGTEIDLSLPFAYVGAFGALLLMQWTLQKPIR